ncbi:MAG: DsrE family protein, partial [Thermoplasmata archaeon]|nr:DsrE family protein [Thermoplasmata archaeon]
YRDFAGADDLTRASRALMGLIALDGLMDALTKDKPLAPEDSGREELTCFHLLLTFWARRRLGLEPGFAAIDPGEARAFFAILREGETAPPYQMARFREVFINDMLGRVLAKGGRVAACGSCMKARGLSVDGLLKGVEQGSMALLSEWTESCTKIHSF